MYLLLNRSTIEKKVDSSDYFAGPDQKSWPKLQTVWQVQEERLKAHSYCGQNTMHHWSSFHNVFCWVRHTRRTSLRVWCSAARGFRGTDEPSVPVHKWPRPGRHGSRLPYPLLMVEWNSYLQIKKISNHKPSNLHTKNNWLFKDNVPNVTFYVCVCQIFSGADVSRPIGVHERQVRHVVVRHFVVMVLINNS